MENRIFLSLVFILVVYIQHSQGEEDHDLQAVDIIGNCDFDGLKFYNNECRKFVQCAKPFLYLMHCSEGSYFSQRDQKCSYISELGCVEEQSDLPATTTTATTTTTEQTIPTTTEQTIPTTTSTEHISTTTATTTTTMTTLEQTIPSAATTEQTTPPTRSTTTTTPKTTTTTTTTTTATTTTTTATSVTRTSIITTLAPTSEHTSSPDLTTLAFTTDTPKCREGCYPDVCESDFDAWPADEFGCDYFYECYDGCTCLKQCDEGLWYDEEAGFCNFIPMVTSCSNDVGESSVNIQLNHATILKNRTSMMSPMCTKGTVESCGTNGFYEVWNDDLSTLLIQSCSHGWSCLLRCDAGYRFDQKSEQCVKYS